MKIIELELPDLSDHPPAPKLSFQQYNYWICHELAPLRASIRPATDEEIIAEFMKNEGSQTEEWPDFGG